MTRISQKAANSLLIEWAPPQPLGHTTGYRINYYTNTGSSKPSITSIHVLGGLHTTSYVLTGLESDGYYHISVEGVSEHFSSGLSQAVVHPFHLRGESGDGVMCEGESDGVKSVECEGGSGEGREVGSDDEKRAGDKKAIITAFVGLIIGGVVGGMATGCIVICIYKKSCQKSSNK